MRSPLPLLALAGLFSGAPLAAPADEDRSIPTAFPTTTFAVSTERVKVDLVVRDKKGAILRGLGAADLEVYEDGVRQDVESFDFVERLPGEATVAPGPRTPPAVVAVVFDRLGPGARSFAQQAVLGYLDRALSSKSWMGVFSIDRSLTTLQQFTDDRDALRRSLDRSLSLASTSVAGTRERDSIRNAYAGLSTGIGQAHVAAAELSGVPECRNAEDELIRHLEILDSRLLEAFESLERDEQGFAVLHALLALVGGLEPVPGRKAVVLFSEGLAIPAGVDSAFRSVVAAANRANVSIYTVDAGGLRTTSAADETRRTIDSLQGRLQPENSNPVARGSITTLQPMSGLALLERNEDTLRFAPGSGLGRLADQTGGFLLRDTNDLSTGLAEMDEELGAYYALSYAPKNQAYDGRFRAISVKLKRPQGRLQARKGYLAVKTAALPVPALEYEAPALARLDVGPLPTAVPLRLRGLQFPEEPPFSRVPIVVEVPARGRQDLAVVVLVRDATRRVVAKMSQRYPPAGARAEAGPVLFYRETRLPPGTYSLEAIAYDLRTGAAGAVTSVLDVPAVASGRLRASSLMIVGRAEKLGPDGGGAKPLQYGGVLLYPNLGQPLKREPGQALTFFVTAWPALERPGIEARVEVMRDGQRVGATRATQLRPDTDGRIQLASSLPLEGFAPGAYELRVTLSDGRDAETRSAAVPIAP
jgi:VWFA-related protein